MFKKTLLLTAALVGFAFAVSGDKPAIEAAVPVPSEGSVLVPSPAVEGENALVAEHAAKKEKKAEKKKKGGKKHKIAKNKAGKAHHKHRGHHKHHCHAAGDKITDELNRASVDRKPMDGPVKADNMHEKAIADTQKSIADAKKEVAEVKEAVVS